MPTISQEIDISKWILDRIFSISVEWDNVEFIEECDRYFSETMTKEEAIKTLKYFISYIESN